MASAAEKTVSATEFKAKCLDLMDEMSAGRLRCVHITKRGRAFLSMAPQNAARPSERIFRVFRDTVHVPVEVDLTVPVIDPTTIEALRLGRED